MALLGFLWVWKAAAEPDWPVGFTAGPLLEQLRLPEWDFSCMAEASQADALPREPPDGLSQSELPVSTFLSTFLHY